VTDRRLYLFDDARARSWSPFSRTRPVGELLFGCLLQRERAERIFGPCEGHLAARALAGFEEPGASPVLALEEVDAEAPRVFLSSRAVPEGDAPDLPDRTELPEGVRRFPMVIDGEVVGWYVPAGEAPPSTEELKEPDAASEAGGSGAADPLELQGSVLDWPWSLVDRNGDRIARDTAALHPGDSSFLLTDAHLVGDHHVSLGENVSVDPSVFLDVREGPIWLDDRVRVLGPSRLTGPLYVGPDSVLLGGSIGSSSIGPVCKVKGEVEASVLLGWSNKAHDGYLGHALVGRWVNLGAMTTNSDLKNSYSSVRVQIGPERVVDTGMLKVGAFLGDHVKTGIGTLITTGAHVGAGSNVFGGGLAPRWIPPFSWGSGEPFSEYRLDAFLEVAERTMARRDQELTKGMRSVLERAWHDSADERSSGREGR